MSDETITNLFEERLIREIKEVDKKIADLRAERLTLERLLVRARRENAAVKDVTRRNSLGRVLIEKTVMEALEGSPKPLSTAELYRRAKAVDYSLKSSTFRSHLHRMQKRELIEHPTPATGIWRMRRPTAR